MNDHSSGRTSAGEGVKAALIVAHPGHELRVHHWLENKKPIVFCLTDGSGRESGSRIESTTRLISAAGAVPGPIYGRLTDREVYRMLLAGEGEVFTGLLDELAGALITSDIELVAGDAPEGATPTHDLCRVLIDNAVAAVQGVTGRRILNYDFVLDGLPTECPPELRTQALWLRLDEAAITRKMEAAMAYTELRGEAEEALRVYGVQAFAIECLRPATLHAAFEKFEHEPPAYERYGREGVHRHGRQQGGYNDVITYQQHVKPVIQMIENAAQSFIRNHTGGKETPVEK